MLFRPQAVFQHCRSAKPYACQTWAYRTALSWRLFFPSLLLLSPRIRSASVDLLEDHRTNNLIFLSYSCSCWLMQHMLKSFLGFFWYLRNCNTNRSLSWAAFFSLDIISKCVCVDKWTINCLFLISKMLYYSILQFDRAWIHAWAWTAFHDLVMQGLRGSKPWYRCPEWHVEMHKGFFFWGGGWLVRRKSSYFHVTCEFVSLSPKDDYICSPFWAWFIFQRDHAAEPSVHA